MEIGSAWIVINSLGSNVLKHDITPPEAQILRRMFKDKVGSDPVTKLKITGQAMVSEETGEVKTVTNVHTGQDNLLHAVADNFLSVFHHVAHGIAAASAPCQRDGAVSAIIITPVLDLEEGTGTVAI